MTRTTPALRLSALLLAAALLACGPPAAPIQVPPPTEDSPAKATGAEDLTTEPDSSVADGEVAPTVGPELQLVESWPLETTLDNPSIPDAPDVWVTMIDSAQSTLDFEHFYGSTAEGSRLEDVIGAIARATDRGVQVRFIFDSVFYPREPEVPDRLRSMSGVDVRIINIGQHTGGIQHAKFFVVDGREAYIGSQNFDWRSLTHIQELGVRTASPAVAAAVAEIFEIDWRLADNTPLRDAFPVADATSLAHPGPTPVAYGETTVQVTPAFSPKPLLPHEDYWDLPRLIALIDGAQSRVRVQVMTYSLTNYDGTTNTELDDALVRAAGRGVQVELMVADWMMGTKRMPRMQELQAIDNITVKVVTIPQHTDGFVPFARVIHSKLMTVDSLWAWVGTSNWSGDYFYQTRNLGLIVEGAAFANDVDMFFERLWSGEYAKTVDPEATYTEPRHRE